MAIAGRRRRGSGAVRVAHGRLADALGVRDAGQASVAARLGGDGETNARARRGRARRVGTGDDGDEGVRSVILKNLKNLKNR